MNKEQIIKETAKKTGLTQWHTERVIEGFLQTIEDAVEKGEEVKITNFGKFEKKYRKEKVIKNPLTQEKCTVKDHFVIKFTPGKKFAETVNR